jgi:hypothetical protein
VDEERGHVDVVGRDLEVELLHRVEVERVLLGDQDDGDVVDVDLVLLDEMQQQVERPVERREADLVRRLVGFRTVIGRLRRRSIRRGSLRLRSGGDLRARVVLLFVAHRNSG